MKIMPRRSATQRDAARRRLKISRRSATPTEDFATQRDAKKSHDFLWFFIILLLKFVFFNQKWIKIKIFIICWLKFVTFYTNWLKIIFSWFVDSNLWFLIKNYLKLKFSLFFDSDLWLMLRIVSKLKFAFKVYSKLNENSNFH